MENKDQLEKEHSEQMNQEALDRIQQEEEKKLSQEEADRVEAVFFEDDEIVKLRDGKNYRVPPASLKDARKLMKTLKTVNVDVIILNFLPTDDEEFDKKREDDLYDILLMAFRNYPEIDRDYIDQYVDIEMARKIIDVLIGLNGLKK